jgi:septal ring factor EnvC (AmiA/AmiB activator)
MEAAASASSLDATMVELPRTPSAVVPPALPADSSDFAAALRNADATLQSRGTQQSLRDKERELERAQQVARQLRSEVQELTLAVAASRRREAQLREEAEEADRSRRRAVDALGGPEASAPPEYVKHVLLRFASGTPQVRRALVPALAQVLHLSATEAASVTQACTME